VILNMYNTYAAYVIVPLSVGVSVQRMNQFDRFSRISLRALCYWRTLQSCNFFLIFCSQQCQDDNVQTSDVGETLIPSKTNVLSVVLELYVGLILILDKTTEINDIKTLLPLRSESEVVVVRP
jgi:hypothetical protein